VSISLSSLRTQGPIRRDLSSWTAEVDIARNNKSLWLWVPAFAGTTLKLLWRLADIEHAT
jgi:hypothetical protein